MTPRAAKSSSREHLEIEIKLKIRSVTKIRKELVKLGCEEMVARTLERNWTWDFPGRVLRQKGQLLRLREFGGRCVLTFKGPAQQSQYFKIREERETAVEDPVTLGVILNRLGLKVESCYEKFRTSYAKRIRGQRRCVHLAVDETPIGNYLEIEGLEADIDEIAGKLGFTKEAFIKESYLELFEKRRRKQQDMIFPKRIQ